ncbi:FAD-dependent oxidoreductase [Leptolyngbya cf. ectocarpi LEGE 11479]|uniref:FAD-dependent oxidoreductase n=1 Tax=Leptolyngbya cf. ectocarpi LEGE 11479 TaxID=1828722 RepID=A0A928X448_LEPEC|nr:NAD(P)/FAD-dependent oxidoreductase [Leptolyngbya ectocarpi]MBE9066768.1 FAD-dependent oxidoreductase [Leptolyngbya cf. ectocarpi LEGE 11479]
MARTPLFGLFSRALRFATLANRRGVPIDELYELQNLTKKRRLGRRKFLKTAAAFGGGTMLATGSQGFQNAVLAQEASTPKIAIVGAGLAGLNAAYQLKKAGYRATIYEASNRVGGRMYTVYDAIGEKTWVNLGAEYINSDHDDMIALAEELNIPLLDRFTPDELALQNLYYFDGRTISETELGEALIPIAERIAADAERLDEDWETVSVELDALSISDYCDRLGLSGWLRKFIELVMVTEMGLEANEITALNLVWLIPSVNEDGLVEATGESDERYLVQNGVQAITDAIAQEVQDQIETGMSLTSVRNQGDRFRLTFNYTDIDADIVILAIPFSVLRRIPLRMSLPESLRQFIAQVGYANNVKVAPGYNKSIWREQGLSGLGFTDLPYQTFFETTQLQETETGSLTFYLGGNIGLDSKRYSVRENARIYTQMLDDLIPGLAAAWNGKATRLHWPTHNHALGSYACWKPGQYTGFIQDYVYLEGEEAQEFAVGNLIFAGEHTSDEYQGYMNGAAQSGRLAARAVLNRLFRLRL